MIQQNHIQLLHQHSLSGKGELPEQFQVRLCGIDIAGDDLLAIGDREIKRFKSDGTFVQRFPTRDAGWCITADADAMWVGMQGEIDRLDERGNIVETLGDPARLGRITSLASCDDLLFAADATNNTIHLFRKGIWQREVGRDANTRGFMIPNGVLDMAIDPGEKILFVAHSQKHRVERYDLDGKYIDSFGRFGVKDPAGFGGCCNPTNVAVVCDDVIATSVKAPAAIKLYTSSGEFLVQSVGEPFDMNTKNIDLVANGRGRLYATDPLRCVIEVFEVKNPSVE